MHVQQNQRKDKLLKEWHTYVCLDMEQGEDWLTLKIHTSVASIILCIPD